MDFLVSLLERMSLWAWWALAGLFLIGEVLTGTTFLLWPAAAAFLTGFLALEILGTSWPVQLSVFAILTLVLVWIGDRWVRPAINRGGESGLNDRSARMIGQRVRVVSDFVTGRGRVHFDDTEWAAETQDGSDPLAGSQVVVDGIRGVVLIVHSAGK
ncbi:NfeD family protein [Maricaulis sp.]|uniref:NfeD family protein n=1 Tax=Maricaulis sp. TaxID=1486257 RepID=UPI003A910764